MTPVLLDTQIVLWAGNAPDRLSDEIRSWLLDPAQPVLVSSVSIAELAIKNLDRKTEHAGRTHSVVPATEFHTRRSDFGRSQQRFQAPFDPSRPIRSASYCSSLRQ